MMTAKKFKICIISSQYLGFGKIGGFGMMTRELAENLLEKGFEVTVVVPKKDNQKEMEIMKGVKIYGVGLRNILKLINTFKEINADIYHSQEANLFTYLAQKALPDKKHIITCRDPRDSCDWLIEMRYATWKRRLKTPLVYFFEDGPLKTRSIREADVVGCPAYFLKEKIKKMYGRNDAILLPNIEKFPEQVPMKASKPTVCFVGRLDRRKKPERMFKLAENFPEVQFLVVGRAEDKGRQSELESQASKINNVEMLGYIDKFNSEGLQKIYSRSWILINTSAREGLPGTFIEAAGYGCAILSGVNPDNFASEFGFWADEDNFEEGLSTLLTDNLWKYKAQKGYNYVKNVYEKDKAISKYIEIYN